MQKQRALEGCLVHASGRSFHGCNQRVFPSAATTQLPSICGASPQSADCALPPRTAPKGTRTGPFYSGNHHSLVNQPVDWTERNDAGCRRLTSSLPDPAGSPTREAVRRRSTNSPGCSTKAPSRTPPRTTRPSPEGSAGKGEQHPENNAPNLISHQSTRVIGMTPRLCTLRHNPIPVDISQSTRLPSSILRDFILSKNN